MVGFFVPAGFEPVTLTSRSGLTTHSVTDCPTPRGLNMTILINGSLTDFFKSYRGLCQGFPLSPLLFLLVVECFSRLLKKVVEEGSFHGLKVATETIISHLFFVDNVLILSIGKFEDWMVFQSILTNFCLASSMDVNCQKSCFLAQNIDPSLEQRMQEEFNIQFISIDKGMKYLGFYLKPNNYRVGDWNWMVQKVEKRIGNWSFHWLSLGGRLILAKSVLQSLHVYWLSLVKIPSSMLHRI
jgi:hypothetical protein